MAGAWARRACPTMALLVLLGFASRGFGQDRLIVVTAEGERALMIATPSPLSALPLGQAPHNLAVSPDGTRAWVTVPAALDIAFVKASGRIFSILRMDPSPTATYGPMGVYRHAIEARAGFFKELGIAPGDSVQLERTK